MKCNDLRFDAVLQLLEKLSAREYKKVKEISRLCCSKRLHLMLDGAKQEGCKQAVEFFSLCLLVQAFTELQRERL
jgi:hypothetical protein